MKKYNLSFSADELIILSDFLNRFNKRNNFAFKDQAEQIVLWDIEAQIEKMQENIFSENYAEDLKAAYKRARGKQK